MVEQPFEERAAFVQLVLRHAAARRIEAAHDFAHALLHRLPVRHRRAHVGERPGDAGLELGELRRVGLAVHLDVHERFEPPVVESPGLQTT